VTPFRKLTPGEESDLVEEGRRLLALIGPDTPGSDVHIRTS
jgi:hypothetical protein